RVGVAVALRVIEGVAFAVTVLVGFGVLVGVGVLAGPGSHPFKAASTALTTQSIVTRPVPLQSKAGHWSSDPAPRAILSPVTTSATVPVPLLSQWPTHDRAVRPLAASTESAAPGAGARAAASPTAGNTIATRRTVRTRRPDNANRS